MDFDVRRDLRSLPASLAERVAQHLAATALTVDDDPDTALAHAREASRLAPRIAATREAVGIAAYHAGEYALALVELRAARRMDGSPRHLPLMADAERGLGRPERALDYLSDPGAGELDPAGHAELLVVVAGARRDLGEPDAAVVLLQDAARSPGPPQPWAARLWYAYADALGAVGREEDALHWFESAAAADDEGETDAEVQALRLRGVDPDAADAAEDVDAARSAEILASIGVPDPESADAEVAEAAEAGGVAEPGDAVDVTQAAEPGAASEAVEPAAATAGEPVAGEHTAVAGDDEPAAATPNIPANG